MIQIHVLRSRRERLSSRSCMRRMDAVSALARLLKPRRKHSCVSHGRARVSRLRGAAGCRSYSGGKALHLPPRVCHRGQVLATSYLDTKIFSTCLDIRFISTYLTTHTCRIRSWLASMAGTTWGGPGAGGREQWVMMMKIERLPYLGIFAEVRRDTATSEWVEQRFHVRSSDKFALMDDQETFISSVESEPHKLSGRSDGWGEASKAKAKASSLRQAAQ